MTVTTEELARRLRSARRACRMPQKEVARRLGLSRSSVVQLEAGRRTVSSLELERLAYLYGRDLRDFFAESFSEEDALAALFRTHADLAGDEATLDAVRRSLVLGRAMTSLERVLDLDRDTVSFPEYPQAVPATTWEAIQHGEGTADDERRRLGLSLNPAPDLVELLEFSGVRAVSRPLPKGVSGLTLMDRRIGFMVVVNASESPNRQRFSYAHEYAHLLFDRSKRGAVSRAAENETLPEVRANAFAAAFLMPRAGVSDFIRRLGKGLASRERAVVYDESESLQTERRPAPGSQAIQLYDGVLMAHHFGVSRLAVLYRLKSLGVVSESRFKELFDGEQRGAGRRLAERLGLPQPEPAAEQFRHWFLSLAIEALRRERISRAKMREHALLVGIEDDELDLILNDVGISPPPVDVRLPEF